MPTIHTTMFLFDRPGWALSLLEKRGWRGVSLFERRPGLAKPPLEERQRILMERAGEIEYLITDTTPLTAAFMARATRLRLIAMFGVGIDHIDMAEATRRGIAVSRAIGANSRSVAEQALGAVFCLARKLHLLDAAMKRGIWRRSRGIELEGKNMGIIGLGEIGSRLARLAGAIGMRVFATARTPKPTLAAELGCTILPLRELLALADYLCLCVPGGGKPLIGAAELALMKPTAALINVARGSVVDLEALTAALLEKQLGGAALDVFPQEPMNPAHPIFSLPNVLLTPHTGSDTQEAMSRVLELCLDEVAARDQGRHSPNIANPEVYARRGLF